MPLPALRPVNFTLLPLLATLILPPVLLPLMLRTLPLVLYAIFLLLPALTVMLDFAKVTNASPWISVSPAPSVVTYFRPALLQYAFSFEAPAGPSTTSSSFVASAPLPSEGFDAKLAVSIFLHPRSASFPNALRFTPKAISPSCCLIVLQFLKALSPMVSRCSGRPICASRLQFSKADAPMLPPTAALSASSYQST